MIGVVDRAGVTQTGHVRRSNEDSYLMREPLFIVADGMGGALAGEIASRMCVEAFAEIDLIRLHGEDALREAVTIANRRIHQRAASDPDVTGMGTTVTAALVGPTGRISFANVGDSRAYLLRDGALQRLSEDHSVVAEMVASGQISEQEAESHPQRSVITRALGAEDTVQVDTFSIDAQDGDVVLLCTDGLTTMVQEERIAALLGTGKDAAGTARELVGAALAAGGEDNVTAVLFRMGELGAQEAPAQAGAERRILTSDPDLDDDDEEDTRPFSLRRALIIAAIVGASILALTGGTLIGLRESHFIGANEATQHIEIYQGLPIELFAGIKLYHAVYTSPATYNSLDPEQRRKLFDHTLRSMSDARRVMQQIEAASP
ncbi:MAG: Stp1/IreP family PP2C-type Ser/Thr phosphatase [Gaiellales bacterium]